MVAGGSSFALSKSIFEKASTYLEFASIRVLYDLVTIIFVVGIYFATFVFTPGDLKQSAKCVASCGSPSHPPAWFPKPHPTNHSQRAKQPSSSLPWRPPILGGLAAPQTPLLPLMAPAYRRYYDDSTCMT